MPEQSKKKRQRPAQHQSRQPGRESLMHPRPRSNDPMYRGSQKLLGKVAIITGGDSGIGRAVSIMFAKEGASIFSIYLEEHGDSRETQEMVKEMGSRYVGYATDIGVKANCRKAIAQARKEFGRVDILVNNVAEQHQQKSITGISEKQLERTFRTNIFSYFFMIQSSLPMMKRGSCIINTASVTAYRGSPSLIDYSSTKGAIVALTRSLALNLADKGIRVNAVAPGPVWTPLIPASFKGKKVAEFGSDVPLGRAGQPEEIAPSFVFLASDDSSYMSGQVLHPNGGEIINT